MYSVRSATGAERTMVQSQETRPPLEPELATEGSIEKGVAFEQAIDDIDQSSD